MYDFNDERIDECSSCGALDWQPCTDDDIVINYPVADPNALHPAQYVKTS